MKYLTQTWERKKYRLFKITCSNISSYLKVQNYFKEENMMVTKCKIHDNFNIPNRFLQGKGFAYQNWYNFESELSMVSSKAIKCNSEATVPLNDMQFSKLDIIPRTLKVFINILSISRNLKNCCYPNAFLPFCSICVCSAKGNLFVYS